MTATTLGTFQPARTISLWQAIERAKDTLELMQAPNTLAELAAGRLSPRAQASSVDQLSPSDVLGLLQDIRIDAGTNELPKSLSRLLADAKVRIKEQAKGQPAINFTIRGLLRTLCEGSAQLT